MCSRKCIILAALFSVSGLGAATLALAMPGAAACALVNVANLESLPDGSLVDSSTPEQERARLHELIMEARGRIEAMYGAPRANPTTVFFQDSRTFWLLPVNEYGSTNFVGRRACVIVGPKGRNPDVVAHELMHAELADRVGALAPVHRDSCLVR